MMNVTYLEILSHSHCDKNVIYESVNEFEESRYSFISGFICNITNISIKYTLIWQVSMQNVCKVGEEVHNYSERHTCAMVKIIVAGESLALGLYT